LVFLEKAGAAARKAMRPFYLENPFPPTPVFHGEVPELLL
jgi:hypothetical protein